jgi:signal transduction histidine kinase/CheY-like chemotaxis protein
MNAERPAEPEAGPPALPMAPAPAAADEPQRMALLRRLGMLDSPPEPSFDGLTRAAAVLAGCPIALVTLLDGGRQWFKSKQGLAVSETPIASSFCAHAALQRNLFEIEDTWADPRFSGNPLVLGEPGIRFYAGQPLLLGGVCLGTLCVIDTQPRRLAPEMRHALQGLADAAAGLIAARESRVALAEQQVRLADIALASGDWLWESDAQGLVQWCVAHDGQAGTGDPLKEGAALPDGRLLDARGEPLSPAATFGSLLATGEKVVRAMLGCTAPGGCTYLSFCAVPRFDAAGGLLGFRGTARDMSQAVAHERERYAADLALRLERDAARQIARLRSEVVSKVSHELRTPLNAVLGFAQLLLREPQHATLYATHIRRAGTHLLALVNDMLDLARLESGRATVDLRAISTAAVVQRCLDLLGPDAEHRGVALAAQFDAGAEGVLADQRGLTQAVLNLAGNALKFSPAGGVVRVRAWREAAHAVCITVSDEGPGIAPGQIELLFQPFSQLPGGGGGAGTGLGLAISRQLVRGMNGEITVRSRLGHGSSFTITLPPADCSLEPAFADSMFSLLDTSPPEPAGAPLHVLYIEDEPVNVLVVERMLAHLGGVRLDHAATAEQGRQKARRPGLGLILLDMNLPDGHGLEVLEALRSDPRTAQVPVVALSADALPASIAGALAAGFDDYLTKPVDLAALESAVCRFRQAAAVGSEDG